MVPVGRSSRGGAGPCSSRAPATGWPDRRSSPPRSERRRQKHSLTSRKPGCAILGRRLTNRRTVPDGHRVEAVGHPRHGPNPPRPARPPGNHAGDIRQPNVSHWSRSGLAGRRSRNDAEMGWIVLEDACEPGTTPNHRQLVETHSDIFKSLEDAPESAFVADGRVIRPSPEDRWRSLRPRISCSKSVA